MNRPSSPQTEGKFTNSCLTSQIMNLISNQTVIVEAVPTAETVLAEPEQKKPKLKRFIKLSICQSLAVTSMVLFSGERE